MQAPAVTYVLVNNLGGITSMLSNLIEYRGPDTLQQDAVMLNIKENTNSPISAVFGNGIPVRYFSYSKKENWYHVFGKLANVIGDQPGVLVTNDVFEMLMLQVYQLPKKVVQIVHDAYNAQLAILYGDVVDKFICHSEYYYEVLRQFLPARRKDIVHIPYGIPLNGKKRSPVETGQPLTLMFLGRHDDGKGVMDLFEINKILVQKNIPVQWLVMGRGPKTEQLKEQWAGESNIVFDSPSEQEGVFMNILKTDVFVFPTKFEGFPVALLEAMAAGVVPVATNLPGGLRELVQNDVNGFLCTEDDNREFADKIIFLHQNREALERMSTTAYEQVNRCYDAAVQSPQYQHFFKDVFLSAGNPRHHAVKKKIGSRLDQPWLPNIVTKAFRGKLF